MEHYDTSPKFVVGPHQRNHIYMILDITTDRLQFITA